MEGTCIYDQNRTAQPHQPPISSSQMMRVKKIVVGGIVEERTSPVTVTVREFDPERDCAGALAVESSCDLAPGGSMSLFTDLLGDPICRIRHSPSFLMLVAIVLDEIVGIVRGCIKVVTCSKKLARSSTADDDVVVPVYAKLAYVLGLRVSPSYRRLGIAMKLVQRLESWFADNGAEYSYMATEKSNEASLRLFTGRLGYTKFRTPTILAQPVYNHRARISPRVAVLRLSPANAEAIYRRRFSTNEFFPRDIDAVLHNKLTLATFLAVPAGGADKFTGAESFLADPPASWAIASVWNSGGVYQLEVRGASRVMRVLAGATRVLDRVMPWFRMPSIPNLFDPFGFLLLYGLGGEGPESVRMARALCNVAHNMAIEHRYRVVATEVAAEEPLRVAIPHWQRMSCTEDMWCMKRLGGEYGLGAVGDWTKASPGPSIFVDPRDF